VEGEAEQREAVLGGACDQRVLVQGRRQVDREVLPGGDARDGEPGRVVREALDEEVPPAP
jgi:hypothetical protein